MKIKKIAAIMTCFLCLASPIQANAKEAGSLVNTEAVSSEAVPCATGLISSYYLNCSTGTKTIYITASTTGTDEMAKIGMKNIKVQRSSNLINWTTEVDLGDKLKDDAYIYSISKYAVTVQGGYYYRVTLTHYAKEQALFFHKTQSVDNKSDYHWIS